MPLLELEVNLTKQTQELLSSADVADLLDCSIQWANRLARWGRIPAQRVGKNWAFHRSDVLEYQKRQQEQKK